METNAKKILVVGLGYRTGLAACNFLAGRGYEVAVTDTKDRASLEEVIAKLNPSVEVIAGRQDPSVLDGGYDSIILSPGVPQTIPLVVEAKRRGIAVISEIELAYRNMKGNIIAITGTDGKSTTTELTGHILRSIGIDTRVGGNIGTPLISLVDETGDETVSVIELSSFQLETVDSFRPDAAAILNVTPDHLDRYDSMEDYFNAKMRIAMNQTRADYFVYYKDDPIIAGGLSGIRSKVASFSFTDKNADAYFERGYVYVRCADNLVQCLDASRLQILGRHNVLNCMAAIMLVVAVLLKRGTKPDFGTIAEACYSFKGLPHRMECVGEYEGRTFINDSKATTVGAVQMALAGIPGDVVLILGGHTKGDDYSRLSEAMKGRVKTLVLIGESADEFSKLFSPFNCVRAGSLDEAVVKAMRGSAAGDTIILSPACASYDMFKNFEDRGERFRDSVQKLLSGGLAWI